MRLGADSGPSADLVLGVADRLELLEGGVLDGDREVAADASLHLVEHLWGVPVG